MTEHDGSHPPTSGAPQQPDRPALHRVSRSLRNTNYQLVLAERLTEETLGDFPEMHEGDSQALHWGTVLVGRVADRRELYELLHRLNVSGLTVVDMRVLND